MSLDLEHTMTSAGSSWSPVDLGPALRGEINVVVPTVLRREDGSALFYRGCINGVHGQSGDGKSWVCTIAAAQELRAGEHVLWVDYEDTEATMVDRLHHVLGVSAGAIETRLHYFRPGEAFDDPAVDVIEELSRTHAVSLVVIDSVGEAFGLDGIDEDRDAQVAPWLRRVPRRIADSGPAVSLIDHSTKAKDNALFPSGSKRKRAAITGASYLLEATTPLTRDHGGRLRLTCAKDRHGHFRRGETAAVIDFHVYPDTGVSVKVWTPAEPKGDRISSGTKHLTVAQAAVTAAKSAAAPLSGRRLVDLVRKGGLHANDADCRAGIELAVTLGALSRLPGPKRAVLHSYVRDLPDPTQEATP